MSNLKLQGFISRIYKALSNLLLSGTFPSSHFHWHTCMLNDYLLHHNVIVCAIFVDVIDLYNIDMVKVLHVVVLLKILYSLVLSRCSLLLLYFLQNIWHLSFNVSHKISDSIRSFSKNLNLLITFVHVLLLCNKLWFSKLSLFDGLFSFFLIMLFDLLQELRSSL